MQLFGCILVWGLWQGYIPECPLYLSETYPPCERVTHHYHLSLDLILALPHHRSHVFLPWIKLVHDEERYSEERAEHTKNSLNVRQGLNKSQDWDWGYIEELIDATHPFAQGGSPSDLFRREVRPGPRCWPQARGPGPAQRGSGAGLRAQAEPREGHPGPGPPPGRRAQARRPGAARRAPCFLFVCCFFGFWREKPNAAALEKTWVLSRSG